MQPSDIVDQLGGSLFVLLLAGIAGLVVGLVAGVMLMQGRRLVGLPGAAAGIPALVGLGAAWMATGDVATVVGYRLVTLFFALPAAAFLVLFAAVAGAKDRPRVWPAAAVGAVLALATGGVILAGGVAEEDWLYPLVRCGVYALLGVGVAVSMLGGGEKEDGAGPEAAAAAGSAYALVVGLGETSGRALEELFLLMVMGQQEAVHQVAFVEQSWVDVMQPMVPWHQASVGLGCALAVAACIPAVRARRPMALIGLIWVAIAVAAPRVATPTQAQVVALSGG